MIHKIVSGGQTGADRAGLMVAESLGIATGGWMPYGFLAHDGAHPEFALRFGIQEHTSPNYPPWTRRNVQESDGTLRFARHWDTPGEVLTLKMVQQYRKPVWDVDIDHPCEIEDVWNWITSKNIHILNIAGNSEQSAPGIYDFVWVYLTRVLTIT